MKNKVFVWIVALTMIGWACKKNRPAPEELGLTSFLADSTVRITKVQYSGIELGYRFYASRTGKITRLGTRIPDTGTYTVSLWNFDTKTLLAQKEVTQNNANELKLENILPIVVQPNKKYVLSVYYASPKWAYVIQGKEGSTLLPFTKGSITIVNAQSRYGLISTFPSNADNAGLYGYPELVFVAD